MFINTGWLPYEKIKLLQFVFFYQDIFNFSPSDSSPAKVALQMKGLDSLRNKAVWKQRPVDSRKLNPEKAVFTVDRITKKLLLCQLNREKAVFHLVSNNTFRILAFNTVCYDGPIDLYLDRIHHFGHLLFRHCVRLCRHHHRPHHHS